MSIDVLLWTPPHGKRGIGRPEKTYVDQLADDAGCLIEDLPCLMEDREMWHDVVKRVREISRSDDDDQGKT